MFPIYTRREPLLSSLPQPTNPNPFPYTPSYFPERRKRRKKFLNLLSGRINFHSPFTFPPCLTLNLPPQRGGEAKKEEEGDEIPHLPLFPLPKPTKYKKWKRLQIKIFPIQEALKDWRPSILFSPPLLKDNRYIKGMTITWGEKKKKKKSGKEEGENRLMVLLPPLLLLSYRPGDQRSHCVSIPTNPTSGKSGGGGICHERKGEEEKGEDFSRQNILSSLLFLLRGRRRGRERCFLDSRARIENSISPSEGKKKVLPFIRNILSTKIRQLKKNARQ